MILFKCFEKESKRLTKQPIKIKFNNFFVPMKKEIFMKCSLNSENIYIKLRPFAYITEIYHMLFIPIVSEDVY